MASTAGAKEYLLMLSSYDPGVPLSLVDPEQAMYEVGSGEKLIPVSEKAAVVDDIPDLKSAIAAE